MLKTVKFLLMMLALVMGACAQKPQAAVPDPPVSDWTVANLATPKGDVDALTIKDTQYGRDRRIWIYLPAEYNDKSAADYPLIISFDGQDYVNDIPAPTVLDNLIAAKKIEPTVQVFVDNSDDRLGDLANRQKFADFIAKELLPWLRQRYRITTEASKVTLLGYSAGGL